MMRSILLSLFLLAGLPYAASLDVPYFGGKQEQTVTVRTVASNAYFSYSTLDGTSINFGNVLSVRLRQAAPEDGGSSFCKSTDSAVGKIFVQISTEGEARQLKDSGSVWDAY
ncbi:MAG TPA: hypothetical protein VHO02_05590, partial [Fibrobacteria bacterium]|nr:hypothetical protein [Fibrobacteria bacterium]